MPSLSEYLQEFIRPREDDFILDILSKGGAYNSQDQRPVSEQLAQNFSDAMPAPGGGGRVANGLATLFNIGMPARAEAQPIVEQPPMPVTPEPLSNSNYQPDADVYNEVAATKPVDQSSLSDAVQAMLNGKMLVGRGKQFSSVDKPTGLDKFGYSKMPGNIARDWITEQRDKEADKENARDLKKINADKAPRMIAALLEARKAASQEAMPGLSAWQEDYATKKKRKPSAEEVLSKQQQLIDMFMRPYQQQQVLGDEASSPTGEKGLSQEDELRRLISVGGEQQPESDGVGLADILGYGARAANRGARGMFPVYDIASYELSNLWQKILANVKQDKIRRSQRI